MPTDLMNTELEPPTLVTEPFPQIKDNMATETTMKADDKTQKADKHLDMKESPRQVEKSTKSVAESSRNVEIEDEYIVKDDSENWRDFENDFNLLEERLPDLTAEEIHEISKEDAIPLNFLKQFDAENEVSIVAL